MMEVLQPIAFDVLQCMTHLFDFFLYCVSWSIEPLSFNTVYTMRKLVVCRTSQFRRKVTEVKKDQHCVSAMQTTAPVALFISHLLYCASHGCTTSCGHLRSALQGWHLCSEMVVGFSGRQACCTSPRVWGGCACGTWQFCLHNGEPCGFVTILCVSVATHVTAHGVHVIAMKHNIQFGSMRG